MSYELLVYFKGLLHFRPEFQNDLGNEKNFFDQISTTLHLYFVFSYLNFLKFIRSYIPIVDNKINIKSYRIWPIKGGPRIVQIEYNLKTN